MKAIHNKSQFDNYEFNTVFNTSNIQNESNSQLNVDGVRYRVNCVQYVKYTK